jgi:hypothetical protein
VAYDGSNFGEAIHGMDRGMGGDRSPSPDPLLVDRCAGCQLPIKHESVLCELCKGMIEAETSHRLKTQEGSMVKDWASGTKTSNGSTLS